MWLESCSQAAALHKVLKLQVLWNPTEKPFLSFTMTTAFAIFATERWQHAPPSICQANSYHSIQYTILMHNETKKLIFYSAGRQKSYSALQLESTYI